MAEITVKGYVNKPAVKEGSKGSFSTFTLAERQKQRDGTFAKVYYEVVDFKSAEPPPESSFVTIKGWFSVREYTKKDQTKGTGLNINCQEIEIAPPREGAGIAGLGPAVIPEDPFDLNS